MSSIKAVYQYKGNGNCQSHCGLEIVRTLSGRIKVTLTELPENKGTSITNCYERLASRIYKEFLGNFSPDSIDWYEEYLQGGLSGKEKTLDRVHLEFTEGEFHNPRWEVCKRQRQN